MVFIYGKIKKWLKLRGIDESLKDLETLKQILEALQLQGLLHSKKQSDNRSFVCNGSFTHQESPIATSPVAARRISNDSPTTSYRSRTGPGRSCNYSGESLPLVSPRNDWNASNRGTTRNAILPTRSEGISKSPSRRPLTVETRRRGNDLAEQRRVSPVHSPRVTPRRTGSDQVTIRSWINKKPTVETNQKEERVFAMAEDELSTVFDNSFSTSSPTDAKRSKVEYSGKV